MRVRNLVVLSGGIVLLTAGALAWRYSWHRLDPVPGVTPVTPPVPVMTYAQYRELDVKLPHVLRFDMGDGELLYIGTRHTTDPSNPQIELIREMWTSFAPTVALAEPRLGFFIGPLGPGVRQFGEAGAVFALARADGVPVYTLEAPLETEMRAVLAEWPASEAAAYYVLRASLGRGDPAAVEREARSLIAKRTRWPGLEGSLDWTRLDSLMRAAFPDSADWRMLSPSVTWPGHDDTFLNRVSTTVNRFRDEYMLGVLATLLRQGRRVFAVVGGTHVVMQEPALRSLFGEPERLR